MTSTNNASRSDPCADDTPSIPSLDLFSLKGKHVLLTGGTRGIGAACALALAQAGASICLAVRPPCEDGATSHPALAALPSNVAPNQQHTAVPCDLSDLSSVRSLFTRALSTPAMSGSIDIVVACGGIQRRHPSTDFPLEDWQEVLDVNLTSVFLLAQEAGKHMIPRRTGKVILFGSLLTFQGGLTVPAYAASKGAIGQLTKSLSNEWAKHNVQVNAIAPGYIATDMNERLLADPTRLRQISERIPAGRWGNANDFAGPTVFLASGASRYVSGETLVVDGGWMGR